ncbi:cobalamin-binding protein [Marinobacter changyiensis]|uniref:cobalamin-binding protein n=1 Tax=Marinobacter changyiensis TaxID=2604091 RepID=UPI0012651E98|nr:cobalamin-binding protein [Marinobacter changyiensis]
MRRLGPVVLFALAVLAPLSVMATGPCARDALDSEVCLAGPAERVVSLSPGATELLFSAGAGAKVVAVSAWSDFPAEAAELPRVGNSNRLDLEAIVSLAPDLVVAWIDGNSRSQLERVSDLGIPVFWLAPRAFEDIARAVENLAALTGEPALGKTRAESFREGIASIESRYVDARPVRVFYQIWDQPLMTVNREELISKAIEVCGGVNVFGHLPRLVPRISREAVLAANPDAIVTAGQTGNLQWLEDWQQFPGLTAVAAGNLFLEPPDLLARPTLRIVEGARHLCQTLEQARANL